MTREELINKATTLKQVRLQEKLLKEDDKRLTEEIKEEMARTNKTEFISDAISFRLITRSSSTVKAEYVVENLHYNDLKELARIGALSISVKGLEEYLAKKGIKLDARKYKDKAGETVSLVFI